MQFALVEGTRSSPAPKLRGSCPACGKEALAKCGSQKVWHWAHRGRLHCDPWWENETEWHRAWKAFFPEDWREVVHIDSVTGEKHVADVKTGRGLVIELQHSTMPPEELRSRERFYGNMIWIVDGRPFASQFEVLPDPLPHPKSQLLSEVVFYSQQAGIYCKRSEVNSGSSMVELHNARNIEHEIAVDYRGHHFYKWRRPREVWLEATAPVFLDFGTDELIRLMRYNPESQRCIQRVQKHALVAKNVGPPRTGAEGA